MKRRPVHLLFAVAAGVGLAATAFEAAQLRAALAVRRATESAAAGAALGDGAAPEARLAHAQWLGRNGDADGAVREYKILVQQARRDDIRRIARYDLGNLHLREALREDVRRSPRATPLIELAKQSYRDLLREAPAEWDARYNLERALRLAPEADEAEAEDMSTPPARERSVSTLQGARIDLP